jgi:pyridoxine 5-phosphate synthase
MQNPLPLLGVNIDHVATLRQARQINYPDPIHAALQAELAGADFITLHLREDRRHIQDHDVIQLKQLMQTKMNLELSTQQIMIDFAKKIQPYNVCLVPENRQEITTEGGLDVISGITQITNMCSQLLNYGINVSLFIDPDTKQIDAACETGAKAIELHSGEWANNNTQDELTILKDATTYAISKGLTVNVGHGLNYHNVKPVVAIDGITELNIGHAIISRAIFTGIQGAVSDMIQLIQTSRSTK